MLKAATWATVLRRTTATVLPASCRLKPTAATHPSHVRDAAEPASITASISEESDTGPAAVNAQGNGNPAAQTNDRGGKGPANAQGNGNPAAQTNDRGGKGPINAQGNSNPAAQTNDRGGQGPVNAQGNGNPAAQTNDRGGQGPVNAQGNSNPAAQTNDRGRAGAISHGEPTLIAEDNDQGRASEDRVAGKRQGLVISREVGVPDGEVPDAGTRDHGDAAEAVADDDGIRAPVEETAATPSESVDVESS